MVDQMFAGWDFFFYHRGTASFFEGAKGSMGGLWRGEWMGEFLCHRGTETQRNSALMGCKAWVYTDNAPVQA